MATKKTAFVIWAKNEAKLSFFLAHKLDSKIINVFAEKTARFGWLIFLRYFFQAKETWQKLKQENPAVILVQNPPIFATLLVYFFSLKYKSKFVIDTHTAAVLDFKWRVFHFLHKFLAQRALANSFHNFKNLEKFKKWNLKNTKVFNFYTPFENEILDQSVKLLPQIGKVLLDGKNRIKVFMVNRFANDDAFQEVLETAKESPGTIFFVTGNEKKIKLDKNDIPSNVCLTGFLEYSQFTKLMSECDIVLSLTKREDTLLWSPHEAVSLGKPVVLSDSQVLRHYFSSFGIFSNHKAHDLKEKIQEAKEREFEIKQKQKEFQKKSNQELDEKVNWLRKVIEKS